MPIQRTVLGSTPGILDPFVTLIVQPSYKPAGHRSRYFYRLLLVHKASTLAHDPTHCSRDNHLKRRHINKQTKKWKERIIPPIPGLLTKKQKCKQIV